MLTRSKFLLFTVLLVFGSGGVTTIHAQTKAAVSVEGASAFVQNLGSGFVTTVGDMTLSAEEKKSRFRTLLLGGFDVPYMGRAALARNWQSATPEQQSQFLDLYETLTVAAYYERFASYAGDTFTVSSQQAAGGKDVIVESQIARPGNTPVKVQWRVRADPVGLKVIDVSFEGVSMLTTQKSQYASSIKSGGMNALLESMRQRAANP